MTIAQLLTLLLLGRVTLLFPSRISLNRVQISDHQIVIGWQHTQGSNVDPQPYPHRTLMYKLPGSRSQRQRSSACVGEFDRGAIKSTRIQRLGIPRAYQRFQPGRHPSTTKHHESVISLPFTHLPSNQSINMTPVSGTYEYESWSSVSPNSTPIDVLPPG